MKTFEQFNFKPFVNDTIRLLNFKKPTKIQERVIPQVMHHTDIIGISQTGTGKTHAFLLPIMNEIHTDSDKVQAVITAPTRELATQIFEHARLFQKANPAIRVSLVIGGNDKQKAIDKLAVQPHVVIGTPGRIRDLSINEQALKITTADIFVVDEADMTLEFGYLEDIDAVAGRMKDDLQMLVFSATIPQNIRPFLRKYMKNPQIIEIDEKKVTTDNIEHILVPVRHKSKFELLKKIMDTIDPYICLIFCNKRSEAREITQKLHDEGYRVGEIHGDLEPRERRQMMRRINNMDYQYIVATDIAARGIDIDGASHIISMDFPTELDFYVHRAGRCGRGKYTGICYSLYNVEDEGSIKYLENKGIKFKNQEIKEGVWVDLADRDRRNKRVRRSNEIETRISKMVSRPTKVKPGYKKKRKMEIQKLVRKEKRSIIQQDIRRQKKERAKQAQIEKRQKEEGNY
ncbi:DEAD/DEAH box helicase [Beduini massiliensis]|uniref:DEAD/DEAH box helicase n=1 Tax=Beduini massiliensis TaxID=1585974 RepID=UPI003569BEB1